MNQGIISTCHLYARFKGRLLRQSLFYALTT
nr:MAG TPA: hypothetical protein [Caudoviricetes sp.]DAY72988.1 MAG TPA: hypothetical protein [Caudoviricetes sp.]